jgi:hypothetical protein
MQYILLARTQFHLTIDKLYIALHFADHYRNFSSQRQCLGIING